MILILPRRMQWSLWASGWYSPTVKGFASLRVHMRSSLEGVSQSRWRVGNLGPRLTVCDLRDQSYRVFPRERDLLSSEGLQSNQEGCLALK